MEPAISMHRPATGTPIAGVCAAIADRTGIDPLIIRVAAVVLAVSSGMGVVLYLAGWVLIPLEGHERGPLLETFPALTRAPRWVLISAVALAVVAVAAALGSVTSLSLFPAIVLGLVYYFGVHRPRRERRLRRRVPPVVPLAQTQRSDAPYCTGQAYGTGPQGRPTDPTNSPLDPAQPFGAPRATASWPEGDVPTAVRAATPVAPSDTDRVVPSDTDRVVPSDTDRDRTTVRPVPGTASPAGPGDAGGHGRGAYDAQMNAYLTHPDPIGLYAPPPPTPRAARLPDPQRVGKRTLSLVTLTSVGLLWTALSLLASTGHPVPAFVWAASALVVVGGALVIGAWVGRPRGLITAAVILGLVATIGGYQHDHPQLMERQVTTTAPVAVEYTDAQALPATDNWDFGRVTVDLSQLGVTEDVTYNAHLGAGSLTILVPAEDRVVVNANVGVGTLQLGDATTTVSSQQRNSTTSVLVPGRPGAPTITINGSTDLGELVVMTP